MKSKAAKITGLNGSPSPPQKSTALPGRPSRGAVGHGRVCKIRFQAVLLEMAPLLKAVAFVCACFCDSDTTR